jgi:RNA polymerase sigma factor (sigma-70 family)
VIEGGKMNRNKLEKIYSKEFDKMLAFIRKHINRQIDIYDELDILQGTFDSLFERVDLMQPIDNMTAYIYRSIRNKIIDLFRKRKLEINENIAVEEIAINQSIVEQMQAEELLKNIWHAVLALPESQRDIFIKTELEDKTFKEISLETGISINTLLSQKRYAIKKLRIILTDDQNGE